MLEGGLENKVGLDNIIIEEEEERAHRVHGSATGGYRARRRYPCPGLREDGRVGGGSANLTTKSRCKMQNSEEKGEEEEEEERVSLSLFLERIPRCVARKVEVEYFCSEYLSLFLFFLSRRRRYVPLLFVSVEAATGVAAASAPCSSLLSATTSFDSFFLSASTRECVKQNETRVPAPCRLTRLDPSFRPLVLRPREKKNLDRYRRGIDGLAFEK